MALAIEPMPITAIFKFLMSMVMLLDLGKMACGLKIVHGRGDKGGRSWGEGRDGINTWAPYVRSISPHMCSICHMDDLVLVM